MQVRKDLSDVSVGRKRGISPTAMRYVALHLPVLHMHLSLNARAVRHKGHCFFHPCYINEPNTRQIFGCSPYLHLQFKKKIISQCMTLHQMYILVTTKRSKAHRSQLINICYTCRRQLRSGMWVFSLMSSSEFRYREVNFLPRISRTITESNS